MTNQPLSTQYVAVLRNVWLEAWKGAAMSNQRTPEKATQYADHCLEKFKERFPPNHDDS